jgi:hypothetical protein
MRRGAAAFPSAEVDEHMSMDAPVDYTNLDGPAFLQAVGTDAKLWADAFMQIWGKRLNEIDHGLMLSWFANAIMNQYDTIRQNSPWQPIETAPKDGTEFWMCWSNKNNPTKTFQGPIAWGFCGYAQKECWLTNGGDGDSMHRDSILLGWMSFPAPPKTSP